jgi:hypothetical protein
MRYVSGVTVSIVIVISLSMTSCAETESGNAAKNDAEQSHSDTVDASETTPHPDCSESECKDIYGYSFDKERVCIHTQPGNPTEFVGCLLFDPCSVGAGIFGCRLSPDGDVVVIVPRTGTPYSHLTNMGWTDCKEMIPETQEFFAVCE